MGLATTSQFVLGKITEGCGALEHPGKTFKGKNAGCSLKTDYSSPSEDRNVSALLPMFVFVPVNLEK